MILSGRFTSSHGEGNGIGYGYENRTDILFKEISLDLSYSLYGHFLTTALFFTSRSQPYSAGSGALARLQQYNQRISDRIGASRSFHRPRLHVEVG
jgi:hypothetical protein